MRSLPILAVAAILLLPVSASAGEAESRTLFAEGRQLREQGKCAEAIVVFKKSLETYPEGLGAMRNVAECEEQLGRLASARRTWRDLKVAVTRAGEARYEGWERDAEEAQKRLDPRVPKVMILLEGEGRISLNGRPLDPRLLGVELEQDLGPLEVELDDGSAVPEKKALVMEEGGRYRLQLRARTGDGPPVGNGKVPEPVAVEPKDQGPSGLLIGGAVSLSLGGAALAGMGVAIGVYQSALSEVEEGCPSYETEKKCTSVVSEAVDQGEASSIAVNVLAVAGGVGVAAGVVLLVVDATSGGATASDEKPTAGVVPSFVPLPGGGLAGLTGFF